MQCRYWIHGFGVLFALRAGLLFQSVRLRCVLHVFLEQVETLTCHEYEWCKLVVVLREFKLQNWSFTLIALSWLILPELPWSVMAAVLKNVSENALRVVIYRQSKFSDMLIRYTKISYWCGVFTNIYKLSSPSPRLQHYRSYWKLCIHVGLETYIY